MNWTKPNLPCGSLTTSRRLIPELRLAIACLCNEYLNVPGSNFFFGLNVCGGDCVFYLSFANWRWKFRHLLEGKKRNKID